MSRRPTPLQIQHALERELRAQEKALREAYVADRLADAQDSNEELEATLQELSSLLIDSLDRGHEVDFEMLKDHRPPPEFEVTPDLLEEPKPEEWSYQPKPPGILQGLFPGLFSAATQRYRAAVEEGQIRFIEALSAWEQRENDRQVRLAASLSAHEKRVEQFLADQSRGNAEVDSLRENVALNKPQAFSRFFVHLSEQEPVPENFPSDVKCAFVAESNQLVIERDLPAMDVVPTVREYRYVKARDEINEIAMPAAERKRIYTSVICQIPLQLINAAFACAAGPAIETVVFNGYVTSIDKSTGQWVRPCILTLRASREHFQQLDLGQVDPEACLKRLSASVSRSPSELVPVRPVLEFNMVDPRFIESSDVLSMLDQRPNLMELTPAEFEALITNLFEKMGLETRLTQPSRDGGVDCVAYDPRPIFGGKVVIQAKRYKHTVGVSAVRDLFGTVQNEGASKGILVTTSGFGRASFEFAAGKPPGTAEWH